MHANLMLLFRDDKICSNEIARPLLCIFYPAMAEEPGVFAGIVQEFLSSIQGSSDYSLTESIGQCS
jgi:hypothetical protein